MHLLESCLSADWSKVGLVPDFDANCAVLSLLLLNLLCWGLSSPTDDEDGRPSCTCPQLLLAVR